jgi:hypothetical protein
MLLVEEVVDEAPVVPSLVLLNCLARSSKLPADDYFEMKPYPDVLLVALIRSCTLALF